MHPTPLSLNGIYRRNGYCSQARSFEPFPIESMQDVLQAIDRILSRICLCAHDIEEISFLYRRVDHLERGMEILSEHGASSLKIIGKVQNKIREILSAPNCSPGNFINLYHLSQFSEIAPLNTQLTEKLLATRRKSGVSFDHVSLARHLPYCISEARFTEDLKNLIKGDPDDAVKEIVRCPMKVLKLRATREAFLETQGSDAYPAYLDELLEGGFLYLYEHLLNMTNCKTFFEREEESKKINTSTLSYILLEIREAIISRVKQEISPDCTDVVFLVGNTGSGISTTFAFLSNEPLKRESYRYELSNQKGLISHSLIHSQTFLPNIRVIEGVAYVDFPGFHNTRGFLIDWGVELAFKALIAEYHPKIMVVESIIAHHCNREALVRLGRDLWRLLGPESIHCRLALTQYLRMPELADLERAQARKNYLEQKIQELKEKIQEKEALIHLQKIEKLERKIQKIEKLERKVKELEAEISDLEASDTPLAQRILVFSKKKLQSKKEKLAGLQAPALSVPNTGEDFFKINLEAEILAERKTIQLMQDEVQVKSIEILQKDQEVKENIEKKENFVLSTLELQLEIIRLDYLDQPSRLGACRQSLARAKRVCQFGRELHPKHEYHLIQLLTKEFASKVLFPPKESFNIPALRNRILETSLINVLTAESFPEIGQLLHLPEMDPKYIKTIDRECIEAMAWNLRGVEQLRKSLTIQIDLEKIIADRGEIDAIWKLCTFSSSGPSQFIDRLKKEIAVVRSIYNQGAGKELMDPWEHRLNIMGMRLSHKENFLAQICSDGFLVELMMLEIREQNKFTGEIFIEAALALAKAVDKQEASGIRVVLAAANAVRQRKAAAECKGCLAEHSVIARAKEAVESKEQITLAKIKDTEKLLLNPDFFLEISAIDTRKIKEFAKIASDAAETAIEFEEKEVAKATLAWKALVVTLAELEKTRTEITEREMTLALIKAIMSTVAAAAVESESLRGSLQIMSLFDDRKMKLVEILYESLTERARVREEMVENWISQTRRTVKGTKTDRYIDVSVFADPTTSLMKTVKEVNSELAQHLGLDLGIVLHRFLFLALLDKNLRFGKPSVVASIDVPKEESFEEGEREL